MTDDVKRRPNARVINPDGTIAWDLVDEDENEEERTDTAYGVID